MTRESCESTEYVEKVINRAFHIGIKRLSRAFPRRSLAVGWNFSRVISWKKVVLVVPIRVIISVWHRYPNKVTRPNNGMQRRKNKIRGTTDVCVRVAFVRVSAPASDELMLRMYKSEAPISKSHTMIWNPPRSEHKECDRE